jgi:DNA-binding transcriptional MerR regulator
MRGIGEVARASGLSVSALRFYDGAGVLAPAEVDPATGYRRYADRQVRAARLIAGLRRVGMPVAEIARAVRDLDDPGAVRRRLDGHRQRLEDGLADAKRELLRIHALLDLEENLMTRITLPAAALAATLDAVRFAAATDPSVPTLGGVLFETSPAEPITTMPTTTQPITTMPTTTQPTTTQPTTTKPTTTKPTTTELTTTKPTTTELTLVATDRYRLAVASTSVAAEGPPIRLVLPLSFVDELRPLLAGEIILDLAADRVRADVAGETVEGKPLDVDFPDHRRLLGDGGDQARRVTVDTAALREMVAAAPAPSREHAGSAYEISVLGVGPAGSLRLAAESEWVADADAHVAVNREFLLQALDAGGAGQLVLELDGPIKPLAVRVPGDGSRFSILMPVRH